MSGTLKKIGGVFFVILLFFVTPILAEDDLEKSKRWQEGKSFALQALKNIQQGISSAVEMSLEKDKGKEMEKAQTFIENLGFESTAQKAFLSVGVPNPLKDITVDDPFGIYYVRLDHLLNYPALPGRNPWDLLNPTNGVIYPIVVKDPMKGEQVQSAVTLLDQGSMKSDKSDMPLWELLEIGSAKEIKLFTDARAEVLKEKKADPFVIFIPALSQVLLGLKDSGNFNVKILESYLNRDEKSSSSKFRPADEVFKELAEQAKKTNYDLPSRG